MKTGQPLLLRILVAAAAFVACSCSTAEVAPDFNRLGYPFYPLSPGLAREYAIEEITFTVANPPDTNTYFLRELIADSLPNTTNAGEVYLLHRYYRQDSLQPWSLDSIWQVRRQENVLLETANNQAVAKLTFPVNEGKTWDGNAWNTLEPDDFAMEQLFATSTWAQQTYDSTLQVVQNNNPDSAIRRDFRIEVYQFGLGLIYKESKIINFCDETECLNQGIIETGIHYKQVLTTYDQQ